MTEIKKKPFFVFYFKMPRSLKIFLLQVSAVFLFGFFATGLLLGTTQTDPKKAGFRFDYGRQALIGVLQNDPYPTLWVTAGSKNIFAGQTIMLSSNGKRGITNRAKNLDGKLVRAEGILIKRGDLNMLQLRRGQQGIRTVNERTHEGSIQVPAPTIELGTWRIAGEICDGKCLAGAMNPGRGLAHKACANICLEGDIPPVFVATQKIEGTEFFLMANAYGEALDFPISKYIGKLVELHGDIEQRGDLMIFKTTKIEAIK